ncbi:MAG: AAA family ATPase, partial [Daejeonella sp.]|uniref:hypothetical protein n=1 Tax=Daejeonella sp. TaxID=2805397 RepID=UPI003C737916
MIKSWTLENFKSVKISNQLEFAPLTIFAGANSSGKSTILQSILLTAQTLQNSVATKSIILNGHISKFGTFNDILSNGAKKRSITIGFELQPLRGGADYDFFMYSRPYFNANELKSVCCEFSFTDIINDVASDLHKLQPRLEKSYVKATRKGETKSEEVEIHRTNKDLAERAVELDLIIDNVIDIGTLEFEVKKPTKVTDIGYRKDYNPDNPSIKYVGAVLSHFVPRFLTVCYDQIEEEKIQFLTFLSNKNPDDRGDSQRLFKKYSNKLIIKELTNILKEVKKELPLSKDAKPTLFADVQGFTETITFNNLVLLKSRRDILARNFFQKVDENRTFLKSLIATDFDTENKLSVSFEFYDYVEYLDYFFKRHLKYLGPLRDEPKSVYPLSGTSDPKDIGFKGENTAAVLEANKNTHVKYITPASLLSNYITVEVTEDTLINAVLDWLDYMGIANKVDTADIGKLGHELKISTQNSSYLHDLTHVGVGVSQVLPILV